MKSNSQRYQQKPRLKGCTQYHVCHTLERVNHKTAAEDRAATPRGWRREAEQRMPGKKKGAEIGAMPCHDDGCSYVSEWRVLYANYSLAIYVFLKNEKKGQHLLSCSDYRSLLGIKLLLKTYLNTVKLKIKFFGKCLSVCIISRWYKRHKQIITIIGIIISQMVTKCQTLAESHRGCLYSASLTLERVINHFVL